MKCRAADAGISVGKRHVRRATPPLGARWCGVRRRPPLHRAASRFRPARCADLHRLVQTGTRCRSRLPCRHKAADYRLVAARSRIDPPSFCRLCRCRFFGQQSHFAAALPAVAADDAAFANHAVAGNQHRHRIAAHRAADGSGGAGFADIGGDAAIAFQAA